MNVFIVKVAQQEVVLFAVQLAPSQLSSGGWSSGKSYALGILTLRKSFRPFPSNDAFRSGAEVLNGSSVLQENHSPGERELLLKPTRFTHLFFDVASEGLGHQDLSCLAEFQRAERVLSVSVELKKKTTTTLMRHI